METVGVQRPSPPPSGVVRNVLHVTRLGSACSAPVRGRAMNLVTCDSERGNGILYSRSTSRHQTHNRIAYVFRATRSVTGVPSRQIEDRWYKRRAVRRKRVDHPAAGPSTSGNSSFMPACCIRCRAAEGAAGAENFFFSLKFAEFTHSTFYFSTELVN